MRIAKINSINKHPKTDLNQKIGYDYSHLFENMTKGVCIINDLGYVEYVNSVYEEMFLVSQNNILGESIFALKNDDVLLTSYREKRSVEGFLNYYISKEQIKSCASPIIVNGKFLGSISLYSKVENSNKEVDEGVNISINKKSVCNLSDSFLEIIGESEIMQWALCKAQKASLTDSTVLIRGESGTGKELVAKAIHKNSKRSNKPFITINCGAIPSNLLESELFGHEQGAFTGAIKRKIGKFEQADKGTIFLDEVGDLPLEMQVKLLRVLQEKEVQMVGGTNIVEVDVRIIAATNRNLEDMVTENEFREDLYYRLNVIPIHLPSLRERKEDVSLLINYFIKKVGNKLGIRDINLTDLAKDCLVNYDWPGNVRELENVIERMIALSDSNTIEIEDIPYNISNIYAVNNLSKGNYNSNLINMNNNGELATLEDYEREIIQFAIKKFGSFNAAGKALGVTHKTVASKARKYNIVE